MEGSSYELLCAALWLQQTNTLFEQQASDREYVYRASSIAQLSPETLFFHFGQTLRVYHQNRRRDEAVCVTLNGLDLDQPRRLKV